MKPLNENVLVERIAGTNVTETGILLKSALENDKAKVLAVGSQVTQVSEGDICFVDWNRSIPVENEKYLIPVDNIVFVYE